ncbi:MAG: class I SAM-dependent methyltransferase [Methylomonas sp.]
MHKAEFDKFATEYHAIHNKNIRLSGESAEFFAEYKIKDIFQLLSVNNKNPVRILDFGAGVGSSAPYFLKYFPGAELTCLDVSENSLAIGRSRFSGQAEFQLFDGKEIPYPDHTFDLIFAACVFHHIPHAAHIGLLREWRRVLSPGGAAVIFEHNPLNPLTVHAVNTCPFDENAKLILAGALRRQMQKAGFLNIGVRYRLFFPAALRFLRIYERWLHHCPLGAQYFVYASKD